MKTDKIIFMKIINNIEMKMKIIKIKYYNKKIQIMLLINILTQKNMSNMKTQKFEVTNIYNFINNLKILFILNFTNFLIK